MLKRMTPSAIKIVSVLALLMLAPSGASAHGAGGDASKAFEAYEKGAIPKEFLGRKNPLDASDENVKAGMNLYQFNCVMCHGANADGQGHMSQALNEKPADLREMLGHYPKVADYYFWIISQGGAKYGIPMPGFGKRLNETQIWQLVTWMQDGFKGAGTEIKEYMHDAPGFGPGQGMGPGMMGPGSGQGYGPGMMGPGSGQGYGPGMMGGGNYQRPQGSGN